jgi:hypothetical protein
MSETPGETSGETADEQAGIGDDQLPDDLVAGDDNPLAAPLGVGEDAGDLLEEGKTADESADPDEAGTEGEQSEPPA